MARNYLDNVRFSPTHRAVLTSYTDEEISYYLCIPNKILIFYKFYSIL